VYTASQQYSEALAYYHTALSLSPNNVAAVQGTRLPQTSVSVHAPLAARCSLIFLPLLNSTAFISGLDRLEKLMRGVDPDDEDDAGDDVEDSEMHTEME
jgi:hypothetical protein